MELLNGNNRPVGVELVGTRIYVELADGRLVGAPVAWWPWLPEAFETAAQYILSADAILWPDYGGVDMEVLLLGLADHEYLTLQQVADQTGKDRLTLNRILLADQKKLPDERRFPGAYKSGDGRRGEWRIPRDAVEQFKPQPPGRPKRNEPA